MASARILYSCSPLHHPPCYTSFGIRHQRPVCTAQRISLLPRDVKKRVGSGKTTELASRLGFGLRAAFKYTSDIPSRGCCPSRPYLLW
ncbi:hypothetical protein D0864_14013 [Hortaea werneckii]|uniref:Uncharacterized protein n=1 Tax=Hortaea werneckii TaxID=91943 RepID=A0A3M7CQ63_HORWE|nr:hypothetical protein D0864_14013 [Hortaea werneckii]